MYKIYAVCETSTEEGWLQKDGSMVDSMDEADTFATVLFAEHVANVLECKITMVVDMNAATLREVQ